MLIAQTWQVTRARQSAHRTKRSQRCGGVCWRGGASLRPASRRCPAGATPSRLARASASSACARSASGSAAPRARSSDRAARWDTARGRPRARTRAVRRSPRGPARARRRSSPSCSSRKSCASSITRSPTLLVALRPATVRFGARDDRPEDLGAQRGILDAVRAQVGVRPGVGRGAPAATRDRALGVLLQGVHR